MNETEEIKRSFDSLCQSRIDAAVAAERESNAQVLDNMANQMEADMEPSTAVAWVRNRAEFIRAGSKA